MEFKNIKMQAEIFHKNYRNQMDLLEKSMLAKVRPITSYDVWALGKQLENFDYHAKFCEEQGNVNLLGKIPDIALTSRAA